MIVIGFWLGTVGYAVFYYGERLFVNQWQPFAAVLGFTRERAYQQQHTGAPGPGVGFANPAGGPAPPGGQRPR